MKNLTIKQLCVGESASVKEAMKRIQSTSKRVLFVVGEGQKMLGSINDGDIRRWILKKGDLNAPISGIYNREPVYVREGFSLTTVKSLMIEHWLETVPVLSADNRVVDMICIDEAFGKKSHARHKKIAVNAVIMAGGKGTRMDPVTRILPKPLLPVGEKPVTEHILERFSLYGIPRFYLILNYKAGMVKTYFENTVYADKIEYVQEDVPCGTAGGLRYLPKRIGEHLFVSNCDMLVKADFADMFEFHLKRDNDITMIGSMRHFRIPYGLIELNEDGQLKRIVEKPEYDHLVNTGMYIIRSKVISLIPAAKRQFHFTHLISKVNSAGGRVGVYPVHHSQWLDIGQWDEYTRNSTQFGLTEL